MADSSGATSMGRIDMSDLDDEGAMDGLEPGQGFDGNKAPGAFRTIGEVARALNIKQHVLRYWEEQFPMLNPVKRSGNRRYYRPEDVAMIETIDRLVHREGYTLRGARLALDPPKKSKRTAPTGAAVEPVAIDTSAASAAAVEPASVSASNSGPLLAELLAIRATLAAALAA